MQRLDLLYKWVKNKTKVFLANNKLATQKEIKFKRCGNYIVMLHVSRNTTTNELRFGVKDKRFAQFRAAKAGCVAIYDCLHPENSISICQNTFWYANKVYYRVGHITTANSFDPNVNEVCSTGIHYFNHWLAAYYYDSSSSYWRIDPFYISFSNNGKIRRINRQSEMEYKKIFTHFYGCEAIQMRFHLDPFP